MSESVPVELVEQVVEITACPEDEAKHLLAACANNVEAAVALFFEQGAGAGGVSDSGGATTSAAAAAASAARSTPPVQLIDDDDGDGVRAPIAPIREQLIMPEDDNFYVAAPPPSRIARSSQRVKICPLRDFAREAALMEEQLLAPGERMIANHLPEDLGGIGSFGSRRAANMVSAAQAAPKHSRLVDLFRPPTDLIYAGTFHIARKHATNLKQWLLVNLQTGNFDSQILNRDVWSDKRLRKLVRRHFVLWQVDADSNEGRRFAAFYKCSKLPYVCVIDPRTGEEVLKILEPKLSNVMPDLQQFLVEHKDFALEDAPSTSKRSMPIIVDDDDDDDSDSAKANGGFAAQSSSGEGSTKKRAKILELSEEEQIAMAIRNSMRENGGGSKNGKNKTKNVDDDDGDDDDDDDAASDFGSIEEFTDDDTKTASELMSYEQLLGSAKDEITMLKVRLLNAEGAEEIVQLKWPSDTTCKALRAYIAQVHSYIPKKDKNYKIISAFPRKTLEESHNDATLKELGLHPSANLHVTLD